MNTQSQKSGKMLVVCMVIALVGVVAASFIWDIPYIKNILPGQDTKPELEVVTATGEPNQGNQFLPELEPPGFRLPRLLRLKVVINRPNIYCSNTAGGPSNGNKAEYIRPYFVFDVYPEGSTNPTHYLIGDRVTKDSIMGWVPEKFVQPWNYYLKALTFLPISNMLDITMAEFISLPQTEKEMLRRKLDQYHIPILLSDVTKFPYRDVLTNNLP